jgi:hypothetical protein
MVEEVLIFLPLGALALFILWESWQRRASAIKPIDRLAMKPGFEPGQTNRENILFTMAAVGVIASLMLIETPVHPPFTGRSAFFQSLLYTWVGPLGMPAISGTGAFIALMAALSIRRRRLQQERN